MGAKTTAATVSGSGIDRGFGSTAIALSAAISIASQQIQREATLYVRDAAGDIYGRVERDAHGDILVYRTEAAK